MQTSKDRILTTHVGSLPRSDRLLKMLADMESGIAVDREEFVAQARMEMTQAVRLQAVNGIDIPCDGEIPRLGFSIYAKNRMSGFGGTTVRGAVTDFVQFPEYAPFMGKRAGAYNITESATTWQMPQCVAELSYDDAQALEELDLFESVLAAESESAKTFSQPLPGRNYMPCQRARRSPQKNYGGRTMKRSMTKAEIAERTARFSDLQSMNVPIDRDLVPQDAMDVIFAREILPIIMEKSKNPFGDVGAIYGANGMAMNISVLPPNQGPCLHAHNATFETFIVLEGSITFHVGEPGAEEHLTLERWDTFSCPPEAYRGFNNASDAEQAVLLTIINGDPKVRDDVNVPSSVTHHLRDTYGEPVVEEFRQVGPTVG